MRSHLAFFYALRSPHFTPYIPSIFFFLFIIFFLDIIQVLFLFAAASAGLGNGFTFYGLWTSVQGTARETISRPLIFNIFNFFSLCD